MSDERQSCCTIINVIEDCSNTYGLMTGACRGAEVLLGQGQLLDRLPLPSSNIVFEEYRIHRL